MQRRGPGEAPSAPIASQPHTSVNRCLKGAALTTGMTLLRVQRQSCRAFVLCRFKTVFNTFPGRVREAC
jgi:hypothetical protein